MASLRDSANMARSRASGATGAKPKPQEILQSGIDAGEFQPVNPVVAAQVLSMTIARICEPEFQLTTGLPSVAALEEALQMFKTGLVRPSSARSRRRS
jgi:hypothetical protein